jgi:hypothetical protein
LWQIVIWGTAEAVTAPFSASLWIATAAVGLSYEPPQDQTPRAATTTTARAAVEVLRLHIQHLFPRAPRDRSPPGRNIGREEVYVKKEFTSL